MISALLFLQMLGDSDAVLIPDPVIALCVLAFLVGFIGQGISRRKQTKETAQ